MVRLCQVYDPVISNPGAGIRIAAGGRKRGELATEAPKAHRQGDKDIGFAPWVFGVNLLSIKISHASTKPGGWVGSKLR